jgi:hypothetical protein
MGEGQAASYIMEAQIIRSYGDLTIENCDLMERNEIQWDSECPKQYLDFR